ncbi:MAG: hypothetical protein HKN47_24155, partial [Pirellulaceae bacterium]|nr:hypothetical protein [Pirellulaceae bacterium]
MPNDRIEQNARETQPGVLSKFSAPNRRARCGLVRPSVLLAVCLAVASLLTPRDQAMAQGDDAKSGYLIEVPLPMGSQSSTELLNQLSR